MNLKKADKKIIKIIAKINDIKVNKAGSSKRSTSLQTFNWIVKSEKEKNQIIRNEREDINY